MKKHIEDYESECEYWADQPTYKVVLFALSILLAAGVIWVVDWFEKLFS